MLRLEGVCADIAGARVLRNISLAVPPGGRVALIGRNGAGKTTTLRALMGLAPVREGKISIDARIVAACPRTGDARSASGMRRRNATCSAVSPCAITCSCRRRFSGFPTRSASGGSKPPSNASGASRSGRPQGGRPVRRPGKDGGARAGPDGGYPSDPAGRAAAGARTRTGPSLRGRAATPSIGSSRRGHLDHRIQSRSSQAICRYHVRHRARRDSGGMKMPVAKIKLNAEDRPAPGREA
jgi:energy-coupling factor transporter ATP-binding protein EcfA2